MSDICNNLTIHKETLEMVRNNMPDDETLYDVAEFFKALGDTTRIKIVASIMENELCVCEISELIGISQSAVSHQLRLLKQARFVKFRRDGKTLYYSLKDEHIKTIYGLGLEHYTE